MTRSKLFVAGVAVMMLIAAQASLAATNVHLCADNTPPNLCGNSNAVIPTTDPLPTLSISQNGNNGLSGNTGTLWVVVMVPNSAVGGNSLAFTANGHNAAFKGTQTSGNRFALTGFTASSTMNSNINAPLSFTSAVIGPTSGYFVYVVNAGSWNTKTMSTFTVGFGGISALPNGTVIWAFLTNPNSTVAVDSSPWSETVGIDIPPTTNVPEPASLSLLATGFLGLAGIRRRKRS